jgi:hypothetical protein
MPFETHDASLPKDRGAILVGVVAKDDAEPAPAQQPRQPLLAVVQGQAAEVLAVELQQMEGIQHGLGDGAAAVQGVEDRYAIGSADQGPTVEHNDAQRRASRPGERSGARLSLRSQVFEFGLDTAKLLLELD